MANGVYFLFESDVSSATYDEGKPGSGQTCPDRKLSIRQPVTLCWGCVFAVALKSIPAVTLAGWNISAASMMWSGACTGTASILCLSPLFRECLAQFVEAEGEKKTCVCSSDVSQGISFLVAICGARYCDNRVNGAETEPMSLFMGWPPLLIKPGRTSWTLKQSLT